MRSAEDDRSSDQSVDAKVQDFDSKNNLRLYLMKSWNLMQNAAPPPEFTNSEIRKLLLSPPQSPSINSTSKEGCHPQPQATSVVITPMQILDEPTASTTMTALNSSSANDSLASDALFIAEDEPNYSILNKSSCSSSEEEGGGDGGDCSTAKMTAAATTTFLDGQLNYRSVAATTSTITSLKTLKSPLSDGLYTYWAVVSQAPTPGQGGLTGPTLCGNYKINLERYLFVILSLCMWCNG